MDQSSERLHTGPEPEHVCRHRHVEWNSLDLAPPRLTSVTPGTAPPCTPHSRGVHTSSSRSSLASHRAAPALLQPDYGDSVRFSVSHPSRVHSRCPVPSLDFTPSGYVLSSPHNYLVRLSPATVPWSHRSCLVVLGYLWSLASTCCVSRHPYPIVLHAFKHRSPPSTGHLGFSPGSCRSAQGCPLSASWSHRSPISCPSRVHTLRPVFRVSPCRSPSDRICTLSLLCRLLPTSLCSWHGHLPYVPLRPKHG